MVSIVLVVFVVQLAIHLVNTVGASTINSILWTIYSRVIISNAATSPEQKALKTQYMKVLKELKATSAQDEFAKWAKLDRQEAKLRAQLEKNKSSTDSTRKTFDQAITILRWLGTNGLRMFLQFWYSRQAMFWIPKGWVPYYAEWLLSFPRAPLGSVSMQAWSLACGAVILMGSDALVAVVALVMGLGSGRQGMKGEEDKMGGKRREVPMKAGGGGGEKKEL